MSRPNNLPGRAGWLVIAGVFAMAVPAVAQVQRVSVATDGTQANGTSFRGAISGNGHVVVFSSQATNLVANDTNDAPDVFVRDLVAHTTTRVSVTSDGSQGNAPSGAGLAVGEDALAASFDGSIVAFTSYAALVADDTNPCGSTAACADVYVRDLGTGTTTRVSVASDGTQGNGPSFAPSLSADGRYVVFTSSASNLVPGDTNGTDDIFLHDRVLHTTTRVSVLEDGGQSGYSHAHGTICADGHTVAFTSYYRATLNQPDRYNGFVFVRSLTTNTLRTEVIQQVDQPVIYMVPALSSDGTKLAVQVATYSQTPTSILGASFTTLIDRTTGRQFTADIVRQTLAVPEGHGLAIDAAAQAIAIANGPQIDAPGNGELKVVDLLRTISDAPTAGAYPSFSASGRYLAFASNAADLVAGDTNGQRDIFVADRDPDGDGMTTAWEQLYGLNPNDASDASADPDHDGHTNLDEFVAATHPTSTHTRYFAEGAVNEFFRTRFAILNPNATAANMLVRFQGANGRQTSKRVTVPPATRVTIEPALGTWLPDFDTWLPDTVFSTVVESDLPVVSDRLMTWGWAAVTYGSSLESSTEAPGTTWYLAEGASGSPYSLYYLLQNPGDLTADVTVTYLLPAPQAPITKTHTVLARSRVTIDVTGEDPALAHSEVSAKITSRWPIVVERTQYLSVPGLLYIAGHAGAAIAAPATRWFLAEGATGFFDEYVLIANAEDHAATVRATYLLEGGEPFTETFNVEAHSRYTIDVKARDSRLLSTPVSVVIESTNEIPLVVERAMWWPHGRWYEASLSAGVTATGTKWAMAEGEQHSQRWTYVLIANTDPVNAGTATVTLMDESGVPYQITKTLPANSRTSVDVGAEFPAIANKRFGIIVESNGVPIVVERSMYDTPSHSPMWSAGGTSVATNITPIP